MGLKPSLPSGRGAAYALCLSVAACGGARHRKVAGPPPEYEPPDDVALETRDGSAEVGGAALGGPRDGDPDGIPADAGSLDVVLVSPDGRR